MNLGTCLALFANNLVAALSRVKTGCCDDNESIDTKMRRMAIFY